MRKKEKKLPPIEKWVANHVSRVADQRHVLDNRVGHVLRFRDHVPERMLENLADYLRELADLALKLERQCRPDIRPGAKVINGTVVKKEIAP
jgi:hypothetical protein